MMRMLSGSRRRDQSSDGANAGKFFPHANVSAARLCLGDAEAPDLKVAKTTPCTVAEA
jgi:hypothetical protein